MSFDFSVLSFFPFTSPPWDLGWVGGKFEIRNPKSEICFGTGNNEKTCRERENQWSG